MSNSALAKLIEKNEWTDIPSKIITREGHTVDTSKDQWHLPYSMKAHPTLDFAISSIYRSVGLQKDIFKKKFKQHLLMLVIVIFKI